MAKVAVDILKQFGDRMELFGIEPDGYFQKDTGEFVHNKIFGTDLYAFKANVGWRKKDENGKTDQDTVDVIVPGEDPEVLPFADLVEEFIEIPAIYFETNSGISKRTQERYSIEKYTAVEILPKGSSTSSKASASKASKVEPAETKETSLFAAKA